MAKVIVECADPNDPKAVQEAVEEMVGKCNITYFRQAEALKEAGKAKSDREAARKIAADTGETDGSVRVKIQRGRHEVAQGVPLIQPKPNPILNPVLTKEDKAFIINQANKIKAEKRTEKKEEKKAILESVVVEEPKTEPKRLPQSGEWWELGRHSLYCGDTSSQDFISKLPKCAIAFADPPYNADAANWDNDFNWKHDYLIEHSGIVIVTPGIVSIFDFAKTTSMPYLWSVACVISNGMTRGAIGFGNWIYAAVFSNGSIYRNAQDAMKISIKTSETGETTHKGRKPLEFLALLFDRFTNKGDTILDPFLGSGQSLIVCEKIGRVCVGGEISPEFCAEIINRWESLTEETAHVNSI